MRMYRDPQRDVLAAPTDAALREAGPAVEAATGAELREEAVPGPAGGTKVNLRGRIRPAVVRYAGTGGAAHECVQSPAGRMMSRGAAVAALALGLVALALVDRAAAATVARDPAGRPRRGLQRRDAGGTDGRQ